MRPSNFTDEMIIEAGKRLQDQDKKVTGYGLRNELGGGDQKRLFSVWKDFTAQDVVDAATETELPAELEESVNSASQTLLTHLRSITVSIHQSATKVAERQVSEITRQYKELEEQTEAELKDAGVIIEKLESEKLQLEDRLEQSQGRLEKALKDSEHHERKAFQLETKLKEMKGVEDLIKRLEALEQKAASGP
ncbi:DNA-binding protein [Marinobacter sp.]|uniref:DNA-binding protein n=1 Tax=Marinobacter sp. TaxID=50741 RepID=UPI000C90A6E9|nr:DNA-binding protein [Marinobacter sp.]MAK48707.1 hypothetical protein [Marinobacter sp.]